LIISLSVQVLEIILILTGNSETPSYVEPPVIPGHEFCGHVHALGDGASDHFGVEKGMWNND